MKCKRWVLWLLGAFTLAACSAKEVEQDTGIIATVGDDFTIRYSRLHAFHQNHEFGSRFPDSELNGYEEALSLLVTNRLKNIDFFESGMHRDSAMELELQRIVNDELINDYFEEAHLARYVNEESIREYHNGMSKEIHFRQIVLEKSQANSPESRREIQSIIDDILTAAEEGESFETLKSIYSRNQVSISQTDRPRSVQWQTNSRNQMFNQLYELNEGDIKVLETSSSFLIIRAERITQQEAPPLDQVRQAIVNNLRTMHYNKSQSEFEEEKEKLLDRDSFQWNQHGLEQIVEWAAQPNFSEFYQDTIKSRLNAGLNFEILNYTEGQVDAKEYLRLLDEVYIMENSQTAGIEEHKKFITEALKRDRIIEKAKEMGLDEHILNPNRQNQILQNRVIQLYNIEKIDSKVPEPNELDLKEFYETHKESLFYQPPRVRIFALIYDEYDKAEDAIRRYEEGVRFEDLETGYQVRTFEKNRNGEIESYMRRENPYLGNAAFSINEGDVYGPEEYHHFEYGKQYAVIKSVNNQSERYISFEEAGERVKEEFHRYHRQQISDSLKQALWDQYPVVIYRNQLVKNIDGR